MEWGVKFPVEEFRRTSEAIAKALRERIHEAAMRAGIAVLNHVQRDYQTKSRHGTGEDGITWDDLSPKTLEARVRRRAPAKDIVEQRRQLAQEIRGILNGGIVPRAKRGQGKEVARDAAVRKLRQKRQDLARKMDNLVIKEMSSYQIGVDTGLQRASAAPGFDDPRDIWSVNPPDNLGGNIFEIDGGSVTIGYNRSYSAAFDADRPIFPETLPETWKEDAGDAVESWANEIVRELLNENN